MGLQKFLNLSFTFIDFRRRLNYILNFLISVFFLIHSETSVNKNKKMLHGNRIFVL